MAKLLWKPTESQIENTNMTQFMKYVNEKYDLHLSNYPQLHEWSTDNMMDFWATLWSYTGIIFSQKYSEVGKNLDQFIGNEWFPEARINFAENLLRYKDDQYAFIFRGETKYRETLTYAELNKRVAQLAISLREIGVRKGDFIAAYQPNLIETIIAMLAVTSIGATWASCGGELGSDAVLDRLGQIKPKILFAADGYFYKGITIDLLPKVRRVVEGLKSIEKVVVTPYTRRDKLDISPIPKAISMNEFSSSISDPGIKFEQVEFNHPGYVMFSSGTTGKPKSMVQGAGGVLLTQLRDLILHTDLKRSDRISYITSPSWMMWNWLTTSLAVGATIFLYDGNPLYPDWGAMWNIIEEEKLSIFGTSASYLHYLHGIGAEPGKEYNLSTLRVISQTASPISADVNEWMYSAIKKDFHFNSITGGSDLNAIFAGGCPILPVYAGQLQANALGMRVEAYDEVGNPIRDKQAELVCENPSPSMPLYFWDDPSNIRYKNAYFDFFEDKEVWRHGDYIIIHSDTGGMTVLGRSDAVLKPSGVRIGTSEIYNIVEALPEVVDSLAIGQLWKNDQRIILFVKLSPNSSLSDKLKSKIKKELRSKASPRHVPSLILETPDIPYTFSMKKVEIAITNIIHNKPVTNRDALSNPESLEFFEKIKFDITE
ncbi:MAG: acetoacetate--CoA ligase [Candidatus Hodarchaeales archaeon]